MLPPAPTSSAVPPVVTVRPKPGGAAGPGQVACAQGAVFLAQLRREFPHVGFVADPAAGMWIAVRGRELFARGRTGIELRERLIGVGLRPCSSGVQHKGAAGCRANARKG